MADPKIYTGGCYCGRVRFEVSTEPEQAIAAAPSSATISLTGTPSLTCLPHLRLQSFGRGKAANGATRPQSMSRCLDGVDISKLNPQLFDGKSL